MNCVQPEARTEMDETWDYDYEESKEFVGASASATKALGYFEVSLSMGHGLDRSDPSTHVDRSEILTCL